MQLHFLTSNTFKIETAKLAFEPFGIEVIPVSLNIPEIQADTNAEIARHSAIEAATLLNLPVMREDHGFFLNAIPGFPGPYMAYFEKNVPPETLLSLLTNKDRTGYFEMALAYATPAGEVTEYLFQIPVTVSETIREGGKDFGWDQILSLHTDPRTLSEYPPQDRYQFFTENYKKLAQKLTKK